MLTYLPLFCSLARNIFRSHEDVLLENLALRQQVVVLSRKSSRPRLRVTDRLFWSGLSSLWSGWRSAVLFVQPETVIRWQRTAWRQYWTWRSRRGRAAGRLRLPTEVRELILRMARENPLWGSVRIQGELRKLGYQVSSRTVRRYRRAVGRHPPSQSWRTFLRNHAVHIWAADFFTVQTITMKTLYVFVLIAHCRRQLLHLNVTAHPTAEWVWQQLKEATPWGKQPKYVIRDRDCCYGGSFNTKAALLGIQALLTPVQAPKANAIAERVIGTLRRECLDHFIIINERHLLTVLREYSPHCNGGRPHRKHPDGAAYSGRPAASGPDHRPSYTRWPAS